MDETEPASGRACRICDADLEPFLRKARPDCFGYEVLQQAPETLVGDQCSDLEDGPSIITLEGDV